MSRRPMILIDGEALKRECIKTGLNYSQISRLAGEGDTAVKHAIDRGRIPADMAEKLGIMGILVTKIEKKPEKKATEQLKLIDGGHDEAFWARMSDTIAHCIAGIEVASTDSTPPFRWITDGTHPAEGRHALVTLRVYNAERDLYYYKHAVAKWLGDWYIGKNRCYDEVTGWCELPPLCRGGND